MLPEKKSAVTLHPVRNYDRELEHLYARRSAIDAVIASLEAYDRHRATKAMREGQRKSA